MGHETMDEISHHWLGHFLCGAIGYRMVVFCSIGVGDRKRKGNGTNEGHFSCQQQGQGRRHTQEDRLGANGGSVLILIASVGSKLVR